LASNRNKLLEILDRDGRALYGLLLRITLRPDTAEELMQELFIKLCNAKNLDRVVNPQGYVRRAAINEALDWRRRRKEHASLDSAAEQAAADAPLIDGLVQAEQLEAILNGVSKLKGNARQAFVMRHLEEKTHDEIAEQLGMTSHHVRSLCHRAREKLRDILRADTTIDFND
jgi:RNA polymerase sigma-70 factor (ECF subfamily)